MSALLYKEAPTEQNVIQCGCLLQSPVVLEDPAHAVVRYAEGHYLPSKLLAGWQEKSRNWRAPQGNSAVPTVVADPDDPRVQWTFVAVRGGERCPGGCSTAWSRTVPLWLITFCGTQR